MRQVSSGGVVLRKLHAHPEVCLITRRLEGRPGTLVWGLPKGHVEMGEDPLRTALREVREETGLVTRPLAPLGAITYWFSVKAERVRYFKTVHFYLLQYHSGDPSRHDREVEDAVWLPVEDAMKRLTYPSERRILRKAMRRLSTLVEIRSSRSL